MWCWQNESDLERAICGAVQHANSWKLIGRISDVIPDSRISSLSSTREFWCERSSDVYLFLQLSSVGELYLSMSSAWLDSWIARSQFTTPTLCCNRWVKYMQSWALQDLWHKKKQLQLHAIASLLLHTLGTVQRNQLAGLETQDKAKGLHEAWAERASGSSWWCFLVHEGLPGCEVQFRHWLPWVQPKVNWHRLSIAECSAGDADRFDHRTTVWSLISLSILVFLFS